MVGQVTEKVTVGDERGGIRALAAGGPGKAVGEPVDHRPHLSPRRATGLLLIKPGRLTGGQQETLARVEAACAEMTALARLIRDFAAMLIPDPANGTRLQDWITAPGMLSNA